MGYNAGVIGNVGLSDNKCVKSFHICFFKAI